MVRAENKLRDTVILGIPFSTRTNEETLDFMEQMVRERSKNMVVTANLDFVVRAKRDPVCKRLMYGASLVTPDGMPLVWAGRTMKPPLTERVAGSDFIPMLLERAARKNYSVFFLGGREDISVRAAEKCQKQFPGLNIVGVYSPPFGTVWEMDNGDIVERINTAAPDILLVAFGNPKQEYWIGMNLHKLNVPVSIGVGGTIDFLSGAIPRAPEWMKKLSAEWLFRLSLEPRRLAKRYAIDLRDGVLPLLLQTLTNLSSRFVNALFPGAESTALHKTEILIESPQGNARTFLFERCSKQQIIHLDSNFEEIVSDVDALILDLRSLKQMDAETVSTLVSIDRRLRRKARHCIMLTSPAVTLALRIARVQDIFTIVRTKESAVQELQLIGKRTLSITRHAPDSGYQVVALAGELSGDSAFILQQLEPLLKSDAPVLLDFSALRILDTGGLQHLLDCWKEARGSDQSIHCIPGNSFQAKILSTAGLKRRFILHSTMEAAIYHRNSIASRFDSQYNPHVEVQPA